MGKSRPKVVHHQRRSVGPIALEVAGDVVDGSRATVGPVAWNASLAPGSSASFGFCAAKGSPDAEPSLMSVQ